MCRRIKCRNCGAESYAAGDTGLVCIQCYGYKEKRIKELEEIYLGQIRVIARSRITHKEKVVRMAALAEQALKG